MQRTSLYGDQRAGKGVRIGVRIGEVEYNSNFGLLRTDDVVCYKSARIIEVSVRKEVRLYIEHHFSCGTERAIPSGQNSLIDLPSRGAGHIMM